MAIVAALFERKVGWHAAAAEAWLKSKGMPTIVLNHDGADHILFSNDDRVPASSSSLLKCLPGRVMKPPPEPIKKTNCFPRGKRLPESDTGRNGRLCVSIDPGVTLTLDFSDVRNFIDDHSSDLKRRECQHSIQAMVKLASPAALPKPPPKETIVGATFSRAEGWDDATVEAWKASSAFRDGITNTFPPDSPTTFWTVTAGEACNAPKLRNTDYLGRLGGALRYDRLVCTHPEGHSRTSDEEEEKSPPNAFAADE